MSVRLLTKTLILIGFMSIVSCKEAEKALEKQAVPESGRSAVHGR